MSGWSKKDIINIIKTDLTNIHNSAQEVQQSTNAAYNETLEYLNSLLEQIPRSISAPLIPKTPKVPRKKDIKRIETIPEDDVVNDVFRVSDTIVKDSDVEEDDDAAPARTSRRAASQKATLIMKKQQSMTMNKKLRRPSSDDEEEVRVAPVQKSMRVSRAKRTKSAATSSDEDELRRPSKYSKTKQKLDDVGSMKIVPKREPDDTYVASPAAQDEEERTPEAAVHVSRIKRPRENSNGTSTTAKMSLKKSQEPAAKKTNVVNETMDIPDNMDVTVEPSLYEDAVGKSIPMNSTMNPNTTMTMDRKMMNVTVVLEPIPMSAKINETITLVKKSTSSQISRRSTLVNEESVKNNAVPVSPHVAKSVLQSKNNLQQRMQALKETMANNEFDALITEDESSPERHEEVSTKKQAKQDKKKKKIFTRSSLLSDDDDDEVVATPPKSVLRDVNGMKSLKAFKANALFSPYAKDSVKKRVEAFEQAGLKSPKTVTEVDAPTRVTRTKTRAMAAAEADGQPAQSAQSDAQRAARKSLAKAKKISLMKQMKENDEGKENNVISSAQKPSRLLAISEKLAQKQQQRTTPVGKSRLQMPMSVNRIYHTPAGNQISNQNKAMTASRTNIVSSVESLLAPPKTLTKSNSNDNLAERKRKLNDEDARRKREEALKAVTEEKRRKREEKEMKNKLAREAKEKLDMEKRLKQEREREEKARALQLLQEKQREENERKRLLQLQRAQEKEERRRQEEQLRQLRLQEQEEAERQLAEQKRREQEAERRKLAEARAQQLAAAEANRIKAHYLAKAKLAASKNQQGPTSYKLDSDPDDDDVSDDESRPKHVIPYWAQANVRKSQLILQQYIPLAPVLQFFGAKKCTPDLTELFKGIKKERLQRTSSAIWKPPPRYSMMEEYGE